MLSQSKCILLFGNFGIDDDFIGQIHFIWEINLSDGYGVLVEVIMSERVTDFENKCINCGKMYSEHPTTGRFSTVILFGHECAWNPDNKFKGFVRNTLKTADYDLLDFGYE
jgi:hypothetical protein